MHTQLSRRPRVARLSYTLAEFCEATGLSRTATYDAIARGELATFKNGRRRYVRAAAADAWLEDREANTRTTRRDRDTSLVSRKQGV